MYSSYLSIIHLYTFNFIKNDGEKMVGWGRDNPQLVACVHLHSDPDLGT